jgi:hypothetical protein
MLPMARFARGQVFERVFGDRRRCARVIAIVDYGRTGWLEFLDINAPPFELNGTSKQAWHFLRQN